MKITLSEKQLHNVYVAEMLREGAADGNAEHNPYAKQIEQATVALKELVTQYGVVMTNMDNGKFYYVYEIKSLSLSLGKRYCLCILIKDKKPYGGVSTKPLNLFKAAYGYTL